jgi:hypothetical protein
LVPPCRSQGVVVSPPVRVRKAILIPKRLIAKGAWKLITGTSRMPKNAFPIGSNYPVTFARNWHWRVDQIGTDDGTSFRLLTGFNRNIEEFASWLAQEAEHNPVLLARYEFHGSHPGWHCHAPCDDIGPGDAGALRTRDLLRFPRGGGFHRCTDFGTTSEEHALARAFNFYRVDVPSDGGMI